MSSSVLFEGAFIVDLIVRRHPLCCLTGALAQKRSTTPMHAACQTLRREIRFGPAAGAQVGASSLRAIYQRMMQTVTAQSGLHALG